MSLLNLKISKLKNLFEKKNYYSNTLTQLPYPVFMNKVLNHKSNQSKCAQSVSKQNATNSYLLENICGQSSEI